MNVQQDLYLASLDTLALFCITVELSGRQDKLASLGTLVNRRHPSLLPSIWKSKQIYALVPLNVKAILLNCSTRLSNQPQSTY